MIVSASASMAVYRTLPLLYSSPNGDDEAVVGFAWYSPITAASSSFQALLG